jgi:hypothetical protein
VDLWEAVFAGVGVLFQRFGFVLAAPILIMIVKANAHGASAAELSVIFR